MLTKNSMFSKEKKRAVEEFENFEMKNQKENKTFYRVALAGVRDMSWLRRAGASEYKKIETNASNCYFKCS